MVPAGAGRFCSQCGALSPSGARFCSMCGRTV
jgi:ribosomal protein L40E